MSYIYVWKGELFILYKLSTCIMLFERADASLCYFSLKNTDEILIIQGFCLLVFVYLWFFARFFSHSHWDVTNTDERLQILTCTRHSFMATEQWGFFCVPRLLYVIRNIHLYGHLRGPVTLSVAERKYKMQNAKYKKCS